MSSPSSMRRMAPTGETDQATTVYALACTRYDLPLPKQVMPDYPLISYDLVPAPKSDFTDSLMDAQYVYQYPTIVPPCSLRIGTLNVNGAMYHPEPSTMATLSHLLDVADISILGITDARIAAPQLETTKSLLRKSLPRGTAIIPFCTDKPFIASHRNTTMGGQLIFIDEQWEKWAGHHRTNPSGLALVVGIRLTYRRTVLSIIQVMVPTKSPGPHTMWQRLSHYLERTKSHLRPDEYIFQTAER
jgi:hypothetical protein